MGKETKLFKSKEMKNRAEVSSFLHQLADKISSGNVVLRQGQEEVTLTPSDNLVLEIDAEDENKGTKGMQHQLEVEIKWYDTDKGGSVELA